ncbi:MAG: GAF domain-containing protein [Myxococcota bacterium]
MAKSAVSAEESTRLRALRALEILDTPDEERFDRYTRLAQRLFGTPVALLSLVDETRLWFKSAVGMGVREIPRQFSFCGHAILGLDVMVVQDAREDGRFERNPLVTGEPYIRFYAGAPVHAPAGEAIGNLCVIDFAPRAFSHEDLTLLATLAELVEHEFGAACPVPLSDAQQAVYESLLDEADIREALSGALSERA